MGLWGFDSADPRLPKSKARFTRAMAYVWLLMIACFGAVEVEAGYQSG